MRTKEDEARKSGEGSSLLGSYQSAEGRFVRKGSVGGWRSKLTDAQVRLIDEYAGDVLATLGYERGFVEGAQAQTVSAIST